MSDCSSLGTGSDCGHRDDMSALSTTYPSGKNRFFGNSSTYGELDVFDAEAEVTVTIPLSVELLNSLHRRRWRHLRGIEKSCKASIRLDRANSTLHVSGTEESVAAVKHRLAGLNGPRRTVSTAVWAELMRTRTVQDPRHSVLMQLQEQSGCRIHIERSSREVRIFGTEADVQVAEQLLDDLGEKVTEADVDVDPSLLGDLVLESLMHSRGVMVQVEGPSLKVFGRKDAVARACEDIREYVANPQSNRLLEEKAKMPVQQARPAPLPTVTSSPMVPKDEGHGHGKCMASCPTCGAANFCPGCGARIWQNGHSPHGHSPHGPSPLPKEGMQMGQMPGGYQFVSMPADMQQAMGGGYMPVQYMPSGMGGQAICVVPQGMVLQMQNADNSYAYTMHGSYGA